MAAARLDISPQMRRLHIVASSLRLREETVHEALAASNGNLTAAEQYLRDLGARVATRPPAGGRPTPLSREERIKKCANILARTPDALDILHASLTKVLAQPHAERLRKVNMTAGPFKERVASVSSSGVELLYACGYEPMFGHVVLQKHDPHLIKLALASLAAARATPAYVEAKAAVAGEQARREAAAAAESAAAARRAAHLAKVPAEPAAGEDGRASTACVISVRLGSTGGTDGAAAAPRVLATRRFDSDNVLTDLVHFIRSLEGVPDLSIEGSVEAGEKGGDKVGDNGLWNVTTRPPRRLDPTRQGSMSLYALDLWPRGQVQVDVSA